MDISVSCSVVKFSALSGVVSVDGNVLDVIWRRDVIVDDVLAREVVVATSSSLDVASEVLASVVVIGIPLPREAVVPLPSGSGLTQTSV